MSQRSFIFTDIFLGNRSQGPESLILLGKQEHTEMACVLSWTSEMETSAERL